MPRPRPLNWVVPKEESFPLAAACEHGLQALCATVSRVAVNREVLAAVWKNRPYTMLELYMQAAAALNHHINHDSTINNSAPRVFSPRPGAHRLSSAPTFLTR